MPGHPRWSPCSPARRPLGIAAQALVLFWFWRRIGLGTGPTSRWRGVGLGTAGRMAGWTFGMLLLTTFAGIVQTQVARHGVGPERLGGGAVDYAWLIFMLPHSVITVSIATRVLHPDERARRAATTSVGSATTSSSAIRGITLIISARRRRARRDRVPVRRRLRDRQHADTVSARQRRDRVHARTRAVLRAVRRCNARSMRSATPARRSASRSSRSCCSSPARSPASLLPKDLIAAGIALVTTIAGTAQAIVASWLLRRRLGTLDGRRIARGFARSFAALVLPLAAGIGVCWCCSAARCEGGFAVSGIIGAIVSMVGHRRRHVDPLLRRPLAAALARAPRFRRAGAPALRPSAERHPLRRHPSHTGSRECAGIADA